MSKDKKFQLKWLFNPKVIVRRTKHGVYFLLMVKLCPVHFVAYLLQSNMMASKLGTALPTINVSLTHLKDILKVKCIKMRLKLVREEKNAC